MDRAGRLQRTGSRLLWLRDKLIVPSPSMMPANHPSSSCVMSLYVMGWGYMQPHSIQRAEGGENDSHALQRVTG